MEKAILYSFTKVQPDKGVFPQDIACLSWAFANMGRGSSEFWDQLGKVATKNINKFTLLDITNTMESFDFSGIESKEFWNSCFEFLTTVEKIEENNHQNVVILAEILTRKEYKNPKVWTLLGTHFQRFIKKGLIDNAMSRARWHKAIYEMNPGIWTQEIEEIYLKSISKNVEDNSEVALIHTYNICLCAFPNFGTLSFWENLLELFIKILEKPEVIKGEKMVHMTANIIYILSTKFVQQHEMAGPLVDMLNVGLDKFYRDDARFLEMTKEKSDLFTQIKAFVLQRYNVYQRIFWTQLKKYRNEYTLKKADIKPLLFRIFVKNGLYFENSKMKEFDELLNVSLSTHTNEQIEEFTNFLWNMLLTNYANNKLILEELDHRIYTQGLKIKTFMVRKEKLKEKPEIQSDYERLIKNYDKKRDLSSKDQNMEENSNID